MGKLFETVDDIRAGAEVLKRRPYGVIETADERFKAVHLRPWPKIISASAVSFLGRRYHQTASGNHCLLYYNQPRSCPNYLALKYVVSSFRGTLRTFRCALVVLDEIARLKQIDAIVCEVANLRISDRLLTRWGWEAHVEHSRRRHFIKRFYGTYPPFPESWDFCGRRSTSPPVITGHQADTDRSSNSTGHSDGSLGVTVGDEATQAVQHYSGGSALPPPNVQPPNYVQ